MRLGRLLLILLLLLVVASVGLAWVGPGLLDWNRYRGAIAGLASSTLGLPVQIEGPVSLVLLPEPELTAAAVGVAYERRGVRFSSKALRLRVAPSALLSGRIDARELVLSGAALVLPWPLPQGALSARPPAWVKALSARVEDGQVTLGGLAFTDIAATLRTVETGTLVSEGTATLFGRAWHFSARLSRPDAEGAAGLELALEGLREAAKTGGSFSGQVLRDGSLTGHLGLWGPDLSLLLPAPPVPFRAEGRLTAAGGLAAADDLAMQIGRAPARGAVALRVAPAARLDIALAASRFDPDGWAAVLLHPPEGLRLPMSLDLSAEAVPLAGGTLRRVRVAFDLEGGATRLREAAAILPGEATLSLAGSLSHADPLHPVFAGHGRLVAPDLRATLQWLQATGIPRLEAADLAALPPSVLRAAEFECDVTASAGRIALGAVSGQLDGSRVTGDLSLGNLDPAASAEGGPVPPRPLLGAGLIFDRLALDPWLPATWPAQGHVSPLLAGTDFDVRLQAKLASWRGTPIEDLALDAAAEAGRLTVRQLEGTAEGARVTAAGVLDEGGRLNEGRLDLVAADARTLVPLLPPDWLAALGDGGRAAWGGRLGIQLQAAGPPEALGLRITADFADAHLEAQPTLNLPARSWTGALALHHPGAPRLLGMFGFAGTEAWLGDGSLSLLAQLSGWPGQLAATHFDLTAATLRLGGQLALDTAKTEPALTGRLAAEVLPLPLSAGWAHAPTTTPLPVRVLLGWRADLKLDAAQVLAGQMPLLRQAHAAIKLDHGRLALSEIGGQLAGGAVSGSVALDASAEPPRLELLLSLAGAALDGSLADLPVDVTAGTLDAAVAWSAAGHSPAALLATLSGRSSVAVRDGTVSGFDLAQIRSLVAGAQAGPPARPEQIEAALRGALAAGSTRFDRLDAVAEASGGTLALQDGRLASEAGEVAIRGSIDLPDRAMDLRLALRPAIADPPELGLRLTGKLADPRRVPELAGAARWLADRSVAPPPPP